MTECHPCLEFFHALQAKHPILPPSLAAPHLYNNISTSIFLRSSHLTSLVVSVSAQITVSVLLDIFFPLLLTFLEKPLTVPSVLFRRAQISSQVCIKRPQLVHHHLPSFLLLCSQLYPFVQLGLSLSLPFYLSSVVLCSKISSGTETFEKNHS